MAFYLNGRAIPLILPYECLQVLECPRLIQVLINEKDRRIAIRTLVEESAEMFFDIQEEYYQGKLPLAIYGDGFGMHILHLMGWNSDTAYEVDYSVKIGPDGERVLVANMDEAREAEKLPTGPYMLCGWQEAAFFSCDDGTQQDDADVKGEGFWKCRMSVDQFRHNNGRRRRGR